MATWRKGQPWRVVRSLDRLNEQIRAASPRAVPPATPAVSWGSIADSAHSTTSDHYPHFYEALGKTAVVCARDFPHAPALGLDAHAVAEQLRLSRDPRIAYVISNGRITGPGRGWEWDDYSGSDPHDTHIHVSTVRTAAADDSRDWQIGQGGIAQMFCKRGDNGENVVALQTALNALGADLKVDGGYGAATADAVKRHIGGDGTEYRGIHFGRMQIALAKRFAGQAGPQGEPGPQGPTGPPGGATVDQVVNELAARLRQQG
ncbi:peptidoglycan-binding protein [Micromonospora sp. NPDC049048]|uniref:peptidoglycan-binding domain-containing protein n=1 Tax=Micromonospora sp. NPDC049048 TaxID=3364263 RepID=UPI0037244E24